MTAKEKHKAKLISFLSNPENEFVNRSQFAEVCGIQRRGLYRHFTPDEFTDIEAEAFEIRKRRMTRSRLRVYDAMEQAAIGYEHDAVHVSQHQGDVILTNIVKKYAPNPAAASVLLDRLEGKVPNRTEVTGKGGERLIPDFTLDFSRLSRQDLVMLEHLAVKASNGNSGSNSDQTG